MSLKLRVGLRLKAARNAAEMTQDDLAAAAGKSKMAISQFERGVTAPTLETIEDLAAALHVSPAMFFYDDPAGAKDDAATKFADLLGAAAKLSESDIEILSVLANALSKRAKPSQKRTKKKSR